jgi:hypothetical protein
MRESSVKNEIILRASYMNISLHNNKVGYASGVHGFGLGKSTEDLVGYDMSFSPSAIVFVEVKRLGKKPTADQQKKIDMHVRNGCIAFYADSVEMFEKKITEFRKVKNANS